MDNYNNICEYFCANRFSVTINFISTLIGAFLGFVFALIIYWISNIYARNNKEKIENRKAHDSLVRFLFLLDSVIGTSLVQLESFKKYSKSVREKPLELSLLEYHATHDRERLINSDTNEIFVSYMKFLNTNNESHKDYKNIFNHADFLYKYFADILNQNQKYLDDYYKYITSIKNDLMNISILLGLLKNKIHLELAEKSHENKEYQFLDKYLLIFKSLKDGGYTNLEPFKADFLKPLENELFESIIDIEVANKIAFHMVFAVTNINNVILNANEHAADFEDSQDEKAVLKAIDHLKIMHSRIKQITSHNNL